MTEQQSAIAGGHFHPILIHIWAASCVRSEQLLAEIPIKDRRRLADNAVRN
jgi:hypothetical protein